MSEITKDADFLLCTIYKMYLNKRKSGETKDDAMMIGGSDVMCDKLPGWAIADIDVTCLELMDAGYLACFEADNTIYQANLTSKGLVYMENRFAGKADAVLEYLAKIKAAVPFL